MKQKTGNSPKTFEFFDDMDHELRCRPDIAPAVVMGNNLGKENIIFKRKPTDLVFEPNLTKTNPPKPAKKKEIRGPNVGRHPRA